jgi:hypothetical protein
VVGGVMLVTWGVSEGRVSRWALREAQCAHLVGLPPLGVSPFVFISPVVVLHASHPSFEGRRAVVVGLWSGCCLGRWGFVQTRKVSKKH